jgi:hypothetical protein
MTVPPTRAWTLERNDRRLHFASGPAATMFAESGAFRVRPHRHPAWKIVLALGGGVEVGYGGNRTVAAAGVIVPPQMAHLRRLVGLRRALPGPVGAGARHRPDPPERDRDPPRTRGPRPSRPRRRPGRGPCRARDPRRSGRPARFQGLPRGAGDHPHRGHRHDRRGRRPGRTLPAAVAHPRPRLGGYPAPAATPVGQAAHRHDRTTGRVRGCRCCFRGLRRPGTPHPHGANPRRPHPVGDPPPGSVRRPGTDPSILAFMAPAAEAIRENSDQRIQEFQQVTCPSFRPVTVLPSWKVSSWGRRRTGGRGCRRSGPSRP